MISELQPKSNRDQIDLSAVFTMLWKRRRLIVFGTLAMTLLAAAASFIIPKTYRSEGFFQLGNPDKAVLKKEVMKKFEGGGEEEEAKAKEIREIKEKDLIGLTIPFYKSNSPQFTNPARLQLLAAHDPSFSREDLDEIRRAFRTARDIGKWIAPVFAFAREDVREFAQVGQSEINTVIGLNLSYETGSAANAQKYVRFFGIHIRDCLLYSYLYDYVTGNNLTAKAKLIEIANKIISLNFEMQQNIEKLADIKAIMTRYPETARIENRQLVSIESMGYRYLSPVTQLVGIESELADQRRELSELSRKHERFSLQQEYFSLCEKEMKNGNKRGEWLFSLLKQLQADVFAAKNLSQDTVREVSNCLRNDLQGFELTFFTNCRFTSGPSLPLHPIKPSKAKIVIVVFLFAVFFFPFLALFLSWWQTNKRSIMERPDAKA